MTGPHHTWRVVICCDGALRTLSSYGCDRSVIAVPDHKSKDGCALEHCSILYYQAVIAVESKVRPSLLPLGACVLVQPGNKTAYPFDKILDYFFRVIVKIVVCP